ncbi:MAG: methyltransferase domain-containing protein [Lachnospiraceae bacterium]|nr:methyltransferase domain-containing protein [Lachnospiraceae bacterium]
MKLYIRELREQTGMTQKELADRMQVSFQTISKWETGVNLPDITHLPRLADVFGVSADVILGLEAFDKKFSQTRYDSSEYWNENRELIKMWKTMYWNDDYFEFLVYQVWKLDRPLDVLDFGCGYGFLGRKLLPLLPEGSSYSGIELDKGQIQEAIKYFKKNGYKHEFFQENIYEYHPQKKYDLVVALFCMSYMQQPEKVIEKMKESLRPGGMLLLIDANLEVEQVGYFSGLEREENGMKCPDFLPLWEYEMAHKQRDYRMATKLPYLLKKCGLKHIQARLSDQVIIYEPSDPEKDEMNTIFRYVYEHEDTYQSGVNYFVSRGCSLQKASEYKAYYDKTREYFELEDSIAVKSSGIYFVYATI